MAGDIDLSEVAIVLPEEVAAGPGLAPHGVTAARGRVLHQYGARVLIGDLGPDQQQSLRDQLQSAAVTESPADIPDDTRDELDEIGVMGLDAFALRQSDDYRSAKESRPLAGETWDTDRANAPDAVFPGDEDGMITGALARAGGPTSARLSGSVAVGIIIVEGPNANLKFSFAERIKVIAEVQNGLSWLGAQSSPGGISWVYDTHVVSLDVQPGNPNLNLAQKEALWRDPAMAKLGYGSGMAGVQSYVEHIRATNHTDWAYCAFFTKYPLGWFAYASIGGPRLVMDYANDGWGPDNIDRVFAHETGHIFGAPDEYASSGCNCGGQWGFFNQPNGNCENCASGGGVACIMRSNSWEMCTYTPWHLGFPQGQRFSGVWRQGNDPYYLWLNADWNNFVAKWQDLATQNLRLVNLQIDRYGTATRYSGAWRQGNDPYYLWVNADWNNFVAKWQDLASKKLRLVNLEITRYGNDTRYSGVWRQGSDAYYLWVNADWNNFVAKWKDLASKNLRLVDLEITRYGNDTRYSGVWRQGSDAYYLWVNADWAHFREKWQTLGEQNLRLVDFEITPSGVEPGPAEAPRVGALAAAEGFGGGIEGAMVTAAAGGRTRRADTEAEGFGGGELPTEGGERQGGRQNQGGRRRGSAGAGGASPAEGFGGGSDEGAGGAGSASGGRAAAGSVEGMGGGDLSAAGGVSGDSRAAGGASAAEGFGGGELTGAGGSTPGGSTSSSGDVEGFGGGDLTAAGAGAPDGHRHNGG